MKLQDRLRFTLPKMMNILKRQGSRRVSKMYELSNGQEMTLTEKPKREKEGGREGGKEKTGEYGVSESGKDE